MGSITVFESQGVGKPFRVFSPTARTKGRKIFKKGDRVIVKEGIRKLRGKVYQYPVMFALSGIDYNVVGVKIKGRTYRGHNYPADIYKIRQVKKLR